MPVVMFWVLDAYYLRQERLFRKLYDHVRVQPEPAIDYSMNTSPFAPAIASTVKVMTSITLALFFGTLLAATTVVFVVS